MRDESMVNGEGIEGRGEGPAMMVEMQRKTHDLYDLTNVFLGRRLDDAPSQEERRKFWGLLERELPSLNAKLQEFLDVGKQIAGLSR